MKLTPQQFKTYIDRAQDKSESIRIQAVYMRVILKIPAKKVAKIVHSPPGTIYNWTHRYKKFGVEGLLNKKKGGRKREFMSKENETKFLENVKNEASAGLIITAKIIWQKAKEKLMKAISRSYIYNLLKRNAWRKIVPRPRNPRSSVEDQENFKKTSHN